MSEGRGPAMKARRSILKPRRAGRGTARLGAQDSAAGLPLGPIGSSLRARESHVDLKHC